jgi:hypothetical protein
MQSVSNYASKLLQQALEHTFLLINISDVISILKEFFRSLLINCSDNTWWNKVKRYNYSKLLWTWVKEKRSFESAYNLKIARR